MIRENKDDYSEQEIAELTNAFNELEYKAQGGELTIEETRIRVAYCRLQRESNFKIQILKAAKVPKEPKEPGTKTPRKKKTTSLEGIVERYTRLYIEQSQGKILTEEEEQFLENMIAPKESLKL